MANIIFNDKQYPIDDSILATATSELQSHFNTVINGTGAKILLGDIEYNIDSTKLTVARNELVAHIQTIAGEGMKVVINGVEYNIDATKVSGAVTELDKAFEDLKQGSDSDDVFINFILQDGAIFITKDEQTFIAKED